MTYIIRGLDKDENVGRLLTCENDNSVEDVVAAILDGFNDVQIVTVVRTDNLALERMRVERPKDEQPKPRKSSASTSPNNSNGG